MTLDRETRDRLRAKHANIVYEEKLDFCTNDHERWPCAVIQLLDAMEEPDAGLRHRHVGIEEIAATLQSLGHIHQQDTSKLFTPEPVDTCQGCGVEWPCETVSALERLFVEEPDAPVLVWEEQMRDGWTVWPEIEEAVIGSWESGSWLIFPPYSNQYGQRTTFTLYFDDFYMAERPTLAEAQDLAERIERELKR